MPDVFFTSGGNPRAVTSIRRDANGQPQSLNASISDGDTIGFHAEGSGSVRFLGIDSPEKSFQLLSFAGARRLDSAEWDTYLTDPFLPQFGPTVGYNHVLHSRTPVSPSQPPPFRRAPYGIKSRPAILS